MAEPDEPTKDEIIKVLREKNTHLSNLLDISEAQKEHLKNQCVQLRETISELMSKNTS